MDAADDSFEKIKKIHQEPLMDFLTYLTYMKDKSIAEKAQNDYEDNLRKQKRR